MGRLRSLEREDLDSLLVIAQLEPDAEGVLQLVPPGPPHDPHQGAPRRGDVVQFGLTEVEVDTVWARIRDLVGSVDAGELPVFGDAIRRRSERGATRRKLSYFPAVQSASRARRLVEAHGRLRRMPTSNREREEETR